jgi:LPXTG-motif cell wall-anchored protein
MSRILARGLTALSIALLGSLGMSGMASAAVNCGDYPNDEACLPAQTSDSVVEPGEPVTVTAGPVVANSEGGIFLASTPVLIGHYQADSAGIITATVEIPENTSPGKHTIIIPGTSPAGDAVTFATEITVLADGDGTGSGLPITGTEIGVASLVGAGLLGAGTIAVVATRRRKATPAA